MVLQLVHDGVRLLKRVLKVSDALAVSREANLALRPRESGRR